MNYAEDNIYHVPFFDDTYGNSPYDGRAFTITMKNGERKTIRPKQIGMTPILVGWHIMPTGPSGRLDLVPPYQYTEYLNMF